MARSARNDLCRREQQQANVQKRCEATQEISQTMDAWFDARDTLRELAGKSPRALAFMLRYIQTPGHSGTDRARACRYRRELRAV